MLGKTNLIVLSACALDVASQDGQLDDSYQELSRLHTSQDLSNSTEQRWIVQCWLIWPKKL